MTAFFEAMTPEGTCLSVDLPTRWMFHAAPQDRGAEQTTLLIFRPAARPHLAVMMADDPEPEFVYPPQGHLRAIAVVAVMDDPRTGGLSFLHPLSHQSLLATRPLNEARHGAMSEDAATPDARFVARPVQIVFVRREIAAQAEAFERVFAAGDLPEGLAACLLDEPADVAARTLRAFLQVLTLAEFGRLTDRLLVDPALLGRLARAMPNDVWITQGLAGLAARGAPPPIPAPVPAESIEPARTGLLSRLLRPARTPPPPAVLAAAAPELPERGTEPVVLPAELDHLATAGFRGRFVSFGQACNMIARSRVAPTRRACIVATARNEGLTLVEWIAYHRCLGVETIFLYSNDNDDASDHLLAALARAGEVRWFDSRVGPGGSAQPKAYGHALGLNAEVVDHAWALVIDLDEFLMLNPDLFQSLEEFLAWQETREVDAIALNWVMMGSDPEPRRADVPLTRRFRRRLNGANAHVKTLFRPQKFLHSGPHFPHVHERRGFVFRDPSGAPHGYDTATEWVDSPAISTRPDMTYACIFHYFFKSADEFLWKFARNRGDFEVTAGLSMQALDPHFVRAFVGQARDTGAAGEDWAVRCAPGLEAEMARLLALPGVADAQRAVFDTYEARIGEVRALYRTSDALAQSGEEGEALLRLLDGGVL